MFMYRKNKNVYQQEDACWFIKPTEENEQDYAITSELKILSGRL